MTKDFEIIFEKMQVNENSQVIKLKGPIDINTSHLLKKHFNDIIKMKKDLIFDLSEVEYVDSSGVATFIFFTKELSGRKKNVYLKNANESIKNIFKFFKLDSLFNIV